MTLQENQSLERVLESAIVVSWKDLVPGTEAGLIHIECQPTPGGTLDCLKVWSSTSRGHWFLACEYWMSDGKLHGVGIQFHNGYASEGLSHILAAVMQHQNAFSRPTDLGRLGLLQISAPTPEECVSAAASVRNALNRVNSVQEPSLAA